MTHRRAALSSLPLFAVVLPLLACSAAEEAEEARDDSAAPAENVGELRSNLEVLQTLCQIVDAIPEVNTGNFHLDDSKCSTMDRGNNSALYYLGSGPGNYVANLYEAAYCTAAAPGGGDSDARATFQTIVGQFGAVSSLRTFGRDNQARYVASEHVGKLVAFGIEIPLQYSATAWNFPREHQWSRNLSGRQPLVAGNIPLGWVPVTKRVPDTNGYYIDWQTQGIEEWSIGGSGIIPITPAIPLHIEVSLKSHNQAAHSDNGRFDAGITTFPNAFQAITAQVSCQQTCTNPFVCAACGDLNPWQVKCNSGGCNPGLWHNLVDGILPYSGNAGGSSGDLIYGDSTNNYWHQGYPAGREPVAGEPQYSALGSSPKLSTQFYFHSFVPYAFGTNRLEFGQTLNFDTRVGAVHRSRYVDYIVDGQFGPSAETARVTDAETAVNLNAYLDVTFDLGFWLPALHFHFGYDLIDRTRGGHKTAQSVAGLAYDWDDVRDANSDAGTAACVDYAPPQGGGPQPPPSAWTGIKSMAAASVSQFHPCNVRVCVPTRPGSGRGTLTYYDQQPDYSLKARATSEACTVCAGSDPSLPSTKIDMCNADGRVIQPYNSSSNGGNCADTGQVCAEGACDDDDDCSGPGSICGGTCCTTPK